MCSRGTPRFRTSYLSYGYVDPVVRGQGLLPRLFVYHNWPLFSLAMAALQNVTAISPLTLMAFFPTVMMVLYLVPLCGLLLMTTDRSWPGPVGGWRALRPRLGPNAQWLAGLWVFVVFQWTDQDYFSPQALAFFFYLGMMVVLAHTALRRDGTFNAVSGGATVLLFTLIVATHVLTGLIALFVIAGLTMTHQLRRPTLLLLCLLVFVAWQAYPAAPFYEFYGHRLLQTVFAAAHPAGERLRSHQRQWRAPDRQPRARGGHRDRVRDGPARAGVADRPPSPPAEAAHALGVP